MTVIQSFDKTFFHFYAIVLFGKKKEKYIYIYIYFTVPMQIHWNLNTDDKNPV